MEGNEVSIHLVKVYLYLKTHPGWHTSRKIAAGAAVAERTARAHALRLVQTGLVDQAEVFPAHQYRFSTLAPQRNRTFLQRLEQAKEIFGLGEAGVSHTSMS
jgi:hypothetical protein